MAAASAVFLAAFLGMVPVAMGALQRIGVDHGELKSMHVREDLRGRGLAEAVLVRLLDEARSSGMQRVSLETGSQGVFKPARAFYRRHGFSECAPYEGYVEDANSVFMTRELE